MKPVRSLAFASLVVLAGSGCNLSDPVNEPPPLGELTHSVSTFQCGPADGPATAIMLARDSIDGLSPSNPYVRVVIQRPASELAGTRWSVGGGVLHDAGAFYFPSSEGEQASSGTVRIDRVVAQERVEGTVDLRFPSRRVIEEFSAPWIEMFILCG